VRVALVEAKQSGAEIQVAVDLDAPAGTILYPRVTDGTYGVTLLDRQGRGASANGGTLTQSRPYQLRLRLGFSNLRAQPGKLVLPIAYLGGDRHTYGFRIERIPIPVRPQ
jgi:hypothetical protein